MNAKELGNMPALPVPYPTGEWSPSEAVATIQKCRGLTKLEYFAGLAMQGLLSNLAAIRKEGFRDEEIEQFAVMRANGLLAELAKLQP